MAKKNKSSVIENLKLILAIIVITFISFIVIVVLVYFVIPPMLAEREYKVITKEGIDYFCKKYNAKESDIEIIENNFYGEHQTCIFSSCGDNEMRIKYNNEEYTIEYVIYDDYYTVAKDIEE